MLALVTCHIFPPQSDTEKKWIPGTWLPGWQLAVFQSPRLHECGPADAHGNAQPFCMDKCIFRKKTPVLQFGHTLEQNSSICPIISYLWMVDLVMRRFSCGASLWRPSTRIRPKKGPAPWILFLTPAPRPLQVTFFWLVKLNICGCTPFARTNVFSEKKKKHVLQFGRVDTKFLNSSHHVLSVDDWPGDATFFLWANLWRSSASIQSKKVQSLGFYFWHLRLGLFKSPFFGWWSWTYVVVPLLQGQMYFQKKKHVLQFGRVDTKFLNSSHHVLSVDDWPGDATFFLWANLWRSSASIQSKKVVPWILFLTPAPWPLEVTFLVGEGEHMRLYPFAKSCKESYPLN